MPTWIQLLCDLIIHVETVGTGGIGSDGLKDITGKHNISFQLAFLLSLSQSIGSWDGVIYPWGDEQEPASVGRNEIISLYEYEMVILIEF